MSYVVVCSVALFVAGLTLFSGFGLGTLLMPTFALFFSVEVAVAATAVVHLANNVFKLFLVGRWADRAVLIRFAVPAALCAMLGAWVLVRAAEAKPLIAYELAGRACVVTVVKVVVAVLIFGFAVLEVSGWMKGVKLDRRMIPVGGALSGFFGGLSGNQGALRTAFLSRAGLEKERLIGTMVASAVVVDVARLCVYGTGRLGGAFAELRAGGGWGLVLAASVAAFAGSSVGVRLVKKVTLGALHRVIAVMLIALAVALGAGLI